MKKIGLVLVISLALVSIFAQEYDTVVELEMEHSFAERIENLIEPILGFSIVDVDLTLQYPSNGLHPYGTDLDSKASLPGIPVAKSKGVMASEIADTPTLPTLILSKKITIHVDNTFSDKILSEQRQKLSEWFKINIETGDMLDVVSDIVVPDVKEVVEKDYTMMMFYILLSVFLIVQIALIFVFIKKTDISSHLVE